VLSQESGVGASELHGGGGPDWLRVDVTLQHLDDAGTGGVQPGQQLRGGPGRDLLTVKRFAEDIAWDMASGQAFLGDERVEAVIADMEEANVAVFGGQLTVTGTKGNDRIWSRKAAAFAARAGDDVFRGSREDDFFDGGRGRDKYYEDPGGPDDVNTCVSVELDPRTSCATQ